MKKLVSLLLLSALLMPTMTGLANAEDSRHDRQGDYRRHADRTYYGHDRDWHSPHRGYWRVVGGFGRYYPEPPTVIYPYPYQIPVVMAPAAPAPSYWYYRSR